MNEREWEAAGSALKTGRYNLLLGAGVSLDSASGISGETCPSGGGLAKLLQEAAPSVRSGSSLNRTYRTLKADQIEQLITRRFSGCAAGATAQKIASFRWKRVFTLNVDDALENAYETRPLTVQELRVFNYTDPYESVRDLRSLPLVHLHGWARRPEDGYVFEIKEYMGSISGNNIWAHVLGSLIRTEPFLVLGSSLEESDLFYFLSDRANATRRNDRPPSILAEPYPDAATEADCEDFDLRLFEGTALQLLEEFDRRFPVRPTVDESISDNLGDIAAPDINPVHLAEFNADFERVPSHGLFGADGGANFAYGHQATWLDIQNSRDVPRSDTGEIEARVIRSVDKAVHLLDGAAGSVRPQPSEEWRGILHNPARHVCGYARLVRSGLEVPLRFLVSGEAASISSLTILQTAFPIFTNSGRE